MLCLLFLVFQAVRACGSHTLHVPENFVIFLSIKILFSDFFFLLVEYTPNVQLKFPL